MCDETTPYDNIVLPFMPRWRRWTHGLRLSILPGLLTATVLLAISPFARGDNTWILPPDQAGDWSIGTHWSGGRPTSSDNAIITNGGTAAITITGEACNTLTLGNGTGTGQIDMADGSLSAFKEYIGKTSAGTFSQSGGTHKASGDFCLGYSTGSTGTYDMSGGQLSTGDEEIGYWGGTGTFAQSGGIHTVRNLCIGGRGSYHLNGTGQLATGAEQVWHNGLFQQSGGTHSTSSVFIDSGGQFQLGGGTLDVNGTNLTVDGVLDGCGATASLTADRCIVDFSGGQLRNIGSMSVSMGPRSLLIVPSGFDPATAFGSFSSQGLVHTAGTTLTVASGQRVGGHGTINDPVICQGDIHAAPIIGSTGAAISLTNGLVLLAGGSVSIGSGILTVNDTVSGISGGYLSGGYERVGKNGSGLFTQSGGSSYLYELILGYGRGDAGTYDLSDGKLSAAQYIGRSGTGVFTQTGGINTGSITLGSASGDGTYNFNGGTLDVSSLSKGSGTANFNFGGGTLLGSLSTKMPMRLTGSNGTAKVNTSDGPVTLSGQLSGPGGITKLGMGVLTLSGKNSYEGSTTVSTGTLRVANLTGSATGSGAVLVERGGTLCGSGSIAGPVTVAGVLAPGDSAGILTVNNQVTFQAGSTFDVEIMGLVAGSGYDQVRTTGPVSLAGSLTAEFDSFTPTGHDLLFVLDNTGTGATTGTFQYADNAKIGRFNGREWYITYDANNALMPSLNGGNDVAIYTVPEPGSLLLLSIGAVGLVGYARRRNRTR